MKFILLINVKMPIVAILIFNSRINILSECFKQEKLVIFQYFTSVFSLFRIFAWRLFVILSFCLASFRYFVFSLGVFSLFRLFAWRLFVISSFRMTVFCFFILSPGALVRRKDKITPGEKTK